jgi:hypothetical protein
MGTFKLMLDKALGCGNHNFICPKVCSFRLEANCPHYELVFQEHFLHTHCTFVERKVVARPLTGQRKRAPFGRSFRRSDLDKERVEEAQWIACSEHARSSERRNWKDVYPYLKVKDLSTPDPVVSFVCCYCSRVSKCDEMIKDHIVRCHVKFSVEGVVKKSSENQRTMITRGSLRTLLFD